jgi:hypothetical protein
MRKIPAGESSPYKKRTPTREKFKPYLLLRIKA